jgi:hypothetical protein
VFRWPRLLRGRLRLGVLAAEALDASRGVDQLLLAGKEGVASGADFDVDVALVGGAGLEARAAGAHNAHFVVVRVNSCFRHDSVKPFLRRSYFTRISGLGQWEELTMISYSSCNGVEEILFPKSKECDLHVRYRAQMDIRESPLSDS